MVNQSKIDIGKNVVIYYEVVECFDGFMLVQMMFKIGCMYQFCVYMLFFGYLLVGDMMYGGCLISEVDLIGSGSIDFLVIEQVLYVWKIKFCYLIMECLLELEVFFYLLFKKLVQLLWEYKLLKVDKSDGQLCLWQMICFCRLGMKE